MPVLATTNFNIILSVLGGWVSLFGLVSYLCKESFYLSEALISLLAGVALSPHAANFIRPIDYALGSEENLAAITLAFSRLVLGVQLVLAGVQLPSRYLKKQWKPLALLVGPIMAAMWMATSLLVWALVPGLPLLHALAIGSCVTPTDPVLSAVIVKGKFADHNVPKELQKIIIAESGANDGLGYPFLFFALYLIQFIGSGASPGDGGARVAMGLWFGETWGYTILLSVVYGAVVGWLAKELLHWAEEHHFVDRESFLVFAISLALFIVGTCGMIGSDDVLACFVAGNVFTWDDWFRLETLDDSLQPTIDMLLNVSIFMWYGAVCPWDRFLHNEVVPIGRLIALGILVLLLRRLPWVLACHKWIPQIDDIRQAIFVGFFGPVGVSAIFYLYITLEFLHTLDVDDQPRSDLQALPEAVLVVVWFIAICSIVVHGLSIPLGKLGFYLPKTLSRSLMTTSSDEPDPVLPFSLGNRVTSFTLRRRPGAGARAGAGAGVESGIGTEEGTELDTVEPDSKGHGVYRIGGSVIPNRHETTGGGILDRRDGSDPTRNTSADVADAERASFPRNSGPSGGRTIRFPDEPPLTSGQAADKDAITPA
ncbi:Sodium/hydrogen exchanger family-domain-containing protein [Chaetomium sp. MPI-SDFR-AT-0129]|nr:Sodium/hydrogen exchanger family-domain-containing protein [Chaetomium sp. MPI-SDFR-AT-0129]